MIDFKIVFIDDNIPNAEEPLVQTLQAEFPESDCSNVFTNPNEGYEYVRDHMNEKMIVFLDWKFSNSNSNGLDILRKIREQTSLLYVVMMSANEVTNFQSQDIISMMNEESFFYYDSNNDDDYSIAINLVKKIQIDSDSRFDSVLEQWLVRHPEDSDKIAIKSSKHTYTWSQMLTELRLQTEVGKSIQRLLNQLLIFKIRQSNE